MYFIYSRYESTIGYLFFVYFFACVCFSLLAVLGGH